MTRFGTIYLLHGKGGRPEGTVRLLDGALRPELTGDVHLIRPAMPHGEPSVLADISVGHLHTLDIPSGSLLVGISLGGLVAAKLQEQGRPHLHVIAISSPTWADGVVLKEPAENRTAIYSSTGDSVIQGRTAEWPILATAYDVPSLSHNTDEHLQWLAAAVASYINDGVVDSYLSTFRSLE